MTEPPKNWAGNYEYRTHNLYAPESVEEVQTLVSRLPKVRVLGSRHSFNGIADSTENLLSLQHLDQIIALDRERKTVTVQSGIRYGQLCGTLHREGFALHNLASLPHISVAGAVSTATHGSGDHNGNLATAVSALEIVMASGEKLSLSREHDGAELNGAVVSLGGLGVITQLTLDLVPTFRVRQDVYENLSLARLETDFEKVVSMGYSVSLFTDWREEKFTQVWIKRRVEEDASEKRDVEPTLFGATLATRALHPLAGMSPENCTEQGVIPGAWHERLPHFRMEFTPSRGEELQSEYLVPRSHALEALRAIAEIKEQIAPLLLVSEVRTIAEDSLWMSPCYRQACVALHFTWKPDWNAVRELLPKIEAQLEPFGARPHWGKLFTMSPLKVKSLFPKRAEFVKLLQKYDPQGKFRNEFLDTYLGNV